MHPHSLVGDMAVTSLRRHKMTVHMQKIGKQIKCVECGKIFQSKDRLVQHARSHRLEDEEQYFSCDDCKYKTNSKAYMKDHVRRMHKASARLGVWMCMAGGCKEKPKSFLNNHQQEKHQQDHANVKCPECGQLFSAVRNMKRHIKTKHKAVESNNISRNSNESVRDENFNPDINDVAFEICN